MIDRSLVARYSVSIFLFLGIFLISILHKMKKERQNFVRQCRLWCCGAEIGCMALTVLYCTGGPVVSEEGMAQHRLYFGTSYRTGSYIRSQIILKCHMWSGNWVNIENVGCRCNWQNWPDVENVVCTVRSENLVDLRNVVC